MNRAQIVALLELLEDIVADNKPWKEKRDLILEETNERSEWQTALEEFSSWFEPEIK